MRPWAATIVLWGGFVACQGSAGSSCLEFFEPRLDQPVIGVRASPEGTLAPKGSAPEASFLGCDLKYWNIPDGTRVTVEWRLYESEEDFAHGRHADRTEHTEKTIHGTGMFNGYLEPPNDADFPPGIYECRWTVHASRQIRNAETSARIVIGDLGRTHDKGHAGPSVDASPTQSPEKKVGGK